MDGGEYRITAALTPLLPCQWVGWGGVGWGRRVGDSMGPRRKAAVALLAGAESGSLAGDRDQPPPSNWESKSSEKLFQV